MKTIYGVIGATLFVIGMSVSNELAMQAGLYTLILGLYFD